MVAPLGVATGMVIDSVGDDCRFPYTLRPLWSHDTPLLLWPTGEC